MSLHIIRAPTKTTTHVSILSSRTQFRLKLENTPDVNEFTIDLKIGRPAAYYKSY